MDFNEAAVFVKVVQAGSFSSASRLLGLPTSTVSTRVARLEKRLGVTLLQRTTRRLHLTDAGDLYFQHAATGLGHMPDAEAAVTESAGEPKGLLRVTASADVGDFILANVINRMLRRYPLVSIDMVLMNRYVDLVAEGVDVAIRTGNLKESTLIARNVGVARWVAFASPDYLQSAPSLNSPQELRHHCCLQFTPLGKESWTLSGPQGGLVIPMSWQVMVNDVRIPLLEEQQSLASPRTPPHPTNAQPEKECHPPLGGWRTCAGCCGPRAKVGSGEVTGSLRPQALSKLGVREGKSRCRCFGRVSSNQKRDDARHRCVRRSAPCRAPE